MSKFTREQVEEKVKKGESLSGSDLKGIDLSNLDFRSKEDGGECKSTANFSGANLVNADLKGTILTGANFEGANLSGANLTKTDLARRIRATGIIVSMGFISATLRNAILKNTEITETLLSYADLENLNLEGAKIRNADFTGARLRNVDFSKSVLGKITINPGGLVGAWVSPKQAEQLHEAGHILSGVNFSEKSLEGINLSGVELEGNNLRDKNLSKANLSKAHLKRIHFGKADLTDTDLSGATLEDCTFNDANLSRTRLEGATLKNTKFSREQFIELAQTIPNLEGINLSGLNLSNIELAANNDEYQLNLSEANLEHANLAKTNLKNANLTKTNLKNVILNDSNLEKTILTGTCLEESELKNINLLTVSGLSMKRVGGANLLGAKLPEYISDEKNETIRALNEGIKNTKKLFHLMLFLCLYSYISIAGIRDVNLIINSALKLPVINAEIPISKFYILVPLLLMGVYTYFHFYLQKVWEGITSLPAIFPDGESLDKKLHPWLLLVFMYPYSKHLKENSPAFLKAQITVLAFLSWWITPLTLAFVWYSHLPKHSLLLSSFHLLSFLASIFFSLIFYNCAIETLKEKAKVKSHKKATLGIVRTPVIFFLIIFSLFYTISSTKGKALCSFFSPPILNLSCSSLVGVNLEGVHLEGADLSNTVGLTWKQLSKAYLSNTTKLPDYLKKEMTMTSSNKLIKPFSSAPPSTSDTQ